LLTDKVAIVSGSGRGIGRAIALALAKAGAKVVISDIDLDSAAKASGEVAALGGEALAVQTNVADELQVQGMVRQCLERFGHIDILVNNAGIVSTGSLTELSVEAWDRVMAVNLRGVFLCCRAVLPLMMAQRSGKIVNIASVAGKRGGGLLGNSCYAASKGGVIAFTKGIAREAAPYNINVNAVSPALTDTDMTSGLTAKQREAILQSMPLGRAGKPEDIAAAVCFLASDSAAFITGEIMDVDGGLMMD
jgi:3-oxoacyl-[acyl-carrier protein] reductase